MKNINSVVLAMCLAFGAGSVFAQDSGMAKDSMSHDAMTQTGNAHDGMKKASMAHNAMKSGTMSKDNMAKNAMPMEAKSSDAMKDSMSHDTSGDNSAQH